MKIRFGIKIKLFLTILIAVFALVAGMHQLMQWSFSRGFLSYVHSLEMQRLEQLVPALEQSYAERGDLSEAESPRRLRRLLHEALAPQDEPTPRRKLRAEGPRPERLAPHVQKKLERLVIFDAQRRPLHAPRRIPEDLEMLPLKHAGQVVGYLGLIPRVLPEDRLQLSFLQKQKRAFALISYLMAIVAAILIMPFAHHLVKRIRTLATGTRTLANGDFGVRLAITSADELGQLSRDFNHLALTLEKNEQQRRQWVADISHELRTPLAVLRGEIEALQDGVRPTTPAALQSLHGEVQRLSRLVEDLYQLALSDVGALDYRLTELDFGALVEESLEHIRPSAERRGLQITAPARFDKLALHADPERLKQLLDNLLGNALKYTDPPGEIVVQLGRVNGELVFDLYDSAPGVAEEERAKLFERLYRVEKSRHRGSGGAGLGLAICHNIVAGHNGRIETLPSPLGGVWIQVRLPLAEDGV